jgi:hypothetical protein
VERAWSTIGSCLQSSVEGGRNGGNDSFCIHEISSKRNAKVETPQTTVTSSQSRIERNIASLLVRLVGLGRGRRRIHVVRGFGAFEAIESDDTDRPILSPTANITRGIGQCRTPTMDTQCLHGISFNKSLLGDFGIHHGCPKIHQALPGACQS